MWLLLTGVEKNMLVLEGDRVWAMVWRNVCPFGVDEGEGDVTVEASVT